ncbi:MAG TPA: E3 binding domain-containing protein, partial [Rhodocyclaceae bacterium]|nr:E3 binding domain-containing protein [Rhodocyclaceae bacterium]
MRRELLVPKLGLTMTEGTLIEWMVKPGEKFGADQSLFVLESDKAATEIPAEADGVLLEISAQVGSTLAVGSVIGYWDDDPMAAAGPSAAGPDMSKAGSAAEPPKVAPSQVQATASATLLPPPVSGERLLATPLARRLARERGVDLSAVQGSGPRGRIRQKDLPAAPSASPVQPPAPVAPPPAVGHENVGGSLRPASSTEQTIARRLVAAKQEIPHFYLSVEAEVSALQALRTELNAAQPDLRFTLNHFIVTAVGRALAQMPE